VVGGTTRARVSSQCWKRQVRLAMRDFGVQLGSRTKLIGELIAQSCRDKGATVEQAKACGDKVEHIFIKKEKDTAKTKKAKVVSEDSDTDEDVSNDKTDTLLFLSPKEVEILAQAFKDSNFNPDEVIRDAKPIRDIEKLIGKPEMSIHALDVALFGRMVAQAVTLNVEAATSFSHAISTHKVTNEVEFFTALDDCQKELGSAHMGSLEFNSATYYRYVSLDVGQLYQTLVGQNIFESIESFMKALYLAVPAARQATQAGNSRWEFARVFVRKGQRLQVPFETAVKPQDGGFLEPSKNKLCEYLGMKEKLDGSLFGKIESFDFGEKADFNIDKLIDGVKEAVNKGKKK
jgi:CRISPR system Cascade subunit CasC